MAVTDPKRGVAVAIVHQEGVRFSVFFAVRDDAWLPLEARWTSGGEVGDKAAGGELRAWTEPTAGLPLRASDIRRFRLGEALAALPAAQHPVEGLTRSTFTVEGQEFHLLHLRDIEAAVRQVRVAAAYERIAQSSTRPVQDTAMALGLSAGQVRGLLSKARQRGYLTSPGEGSTGGQVTDKARRLLKAMPDILTAFSEEQGEME